ncbi:uncharacterized protein G2W53_022470 [Senna tora]|uniref:Uncharacterized protein n=1 Tax=Senna tora TaxID=362788 RepID=A0A834TNS1_9FABA|nr:uncharacterized protein G2W53_022470 [Senna tora]
MGRFENFGELIMNGDSNTIGAVIIVGSVVIGIVILLKPGVKDGVVEAVMSMKLILQDELHKKIILLCSCATACGVVILGSKIIFRSLLSSPSRTLLPMSVNTEQVL